MDGLTGKYKDTKLRGMRKTIAERMAYSSKENAVIMQCRTADVTEMLRIRNKKKNEAKKNGTVVPSINDLVIKATALALRQHEKINSTFEDDIIRTYDDININMAVAIPNGLVTPVIKDVDHLSVEEISVLSKKAAEKIKTGTFGIEDLTGGTFTVTNVGMVGVEIATPIINSPQVGILAIGTIIPRLERINGEIEDRFKMFLSLTVDHRIIDGYPAALFLNTICSILEDSMQIWGE
jgi:pyruvate dehydrogenase E2 component (dihydrolipoamide acetyltransferase)